MMSIMSALKWLRDNNIPIPLDIAIKARAMKQDSMSEVNGTYHDDITQALIDYFEGESISTTRNKFKQATIQSFSDSYDLGWIDGGGELPIEDEDLEWLQSRIQAEFGFIEMLFQEAKDLRKEEDFDYFDWITSKADGYVRTLSEIYNTAKLKAMDDIMVVFDGDDGEESCRSCTTLKGKRHKISWFVKRNYVPPYGIGLDCAKGGHCKHGLYDDKGNQITL